MSFLVLLAVFVCCFEKNGFREHPRTIQKPRKSKIDRKREREREREGKQKKLNKQNKIIEEFHTNTRATKKNTPH